METWGKRVLAELGSGDVPIHNPVGGDATVAPNFGSNTTPEIGVTSGRGVSLRDFPRFNGVNVEDFFEELEMQFVLNGVQQALKRTLLAGLLEGRVKTWYKGLSKNQEGQNYEQLKEEMKEAFPQFGNRNERVAKFFAAWQQKGVKPTTFVAEMASEVQGLGLRMTEVEVVEHIVYRLEPRARDFIELREPQSRGQLYKLAQRYEERQRDEERWERQRESAIPQRQSFAQRNPPSRRGTQEQWRGQRGAESPPRRQSYQGAEFRPPVERSPRAAFENRYQGPRERRDPQQVRVGSMSRRRNLN